MVGGKLGSTTVSVTLIGTATAILQIDEVRFLTDPAFDGAGHEYTVMPGMSITSTADPVLSIDKLGHIDAVLLSHEDHADNLDTIGRRLLDGRLVLTTRDGANNLAPRPDVFGLGGWQSKLVKVGGKDFSITAIPCVHKSSSACIGFVIESPSFGETDGLPNAIYYTGDTILFDELYKVKDKWHVSLLLINLGRAEAPVGAEGSMEPITMDSRAAVELIQQIKPDVVVPQHFDSWAHFAERSDQVKKNWAEAGITNVTYAKPGEAFRVL
ncbi:uncharacterized protein PFL1_00322 [Pseudozyma flocculosa PF-1]|uniref:Related to Zn-dependent hydrolases of the beta-lactamase fold, putative n=1 Tax=Pseudozyma flocculosa TaxID=84751 RepID=A0A5C3ERT0_9BASI|nr:uncharacterized protein PFL1_00322 [Pseudozyma flocculosa PF-1]EPQ32125.1 hypothetical protein PFL1_00322 [Pseudozyma flocculosa PF-1]SPO34938.1 related to Zn-dependent hydrolases of the beta-lactamase fold, putative [Pseudozyma flocculosa]